MLQSLVPSIALGGTVFPETSVRFPSSGHHSAQAAAK